MPALLRKETTCTVYALPRVIAEVKEDYFLEEGTAVGAGGVVSGAPWTSDRRHESETLGFNPNARLLARFRVIRRVWR